ncbi:MAG: ATP-dependent Clp protease adaptor ClpS [Bacteroidetes bacterium]|nr:ATP-dependent Clp protease adaptor ClpS [Bacteroidota bacterium]
MVEEKSKPIYDSAESITESKELILYNDDLNTFDFVIQTLIDVCKHDPLQAEQCSIIVHFKGKCAVKTGGYSELDPLKTEMGIRGLSCVIE